MIETYQPLYRKYRPQQFSDLVGQEMVSQAIGNALQLGKISHAYLFCGPRGTGKTSSARIFAKSLNCAQGPTITPCQVCESCVAITAGNALDVTEIDAASNNGVDSIRDLTDKVQFMPIQGKFKIYIIDEVHMLSTAAFNALLKTLEEPPPNVVFIFATTEPHKVLPTIISRCQRFDFSRITRQQIETHLAAVAQQEGIQMSAPAITLIARHVRGGLRDALGMLDQVSVLGRSQDGAVIQPQDVRLFIGALEDDLLFALTQGILDKNPAAVLSQAQTLIERGVEPTQLVKELTHHFRNLLIVKTCEAQSNADQVADVLDISLDGYAPLQQQAMGFELEALPQMLMRLSVLENQLKHSHEPQLWLEVALLELCYRKDILLFQDMATRLSALETALQSGSIPKQAAAQQSKPVSTPTSAVPNPTLPPLEQSAPIQPVASQHSMAAVVDSQPAVERPVENNQSPEALWPMVLNAIQNVPTKALLKDHFRLMAVSDTHLTLGYDKEPIYDIFRRSPEKLAHLEQAIQTVLGPGRKIQFDRHEAEMAPVTPKPAAPQPIPVAIQPQIHVPLENTIQATAPQTMQQADNATATAVMEKPEPTQTASIVSSISDPVARATAMATQMASEELNAAPEDLSEAKKYTQELLQGKLLE